MFRRFFLVLICCCFVAITAVSLTSETAYGQSNRWTLPYRLSTGKGKASQATLITDDYGYVHAFWSEFLDDSRSLLQYSRFDGDSWSIPIDIYITQPFIGIGSITADIDKQGILHLIWTEGLDGPAYYSFAPAYDALSAKNWSDPHRIFIRVDTARLQIDSKGVFHLVYMRVLGEDPGVYYIHSENQGITWSNPFWIDPDIPEDHAPRSLYFSLDDQDGLHAAWYYVPRNDVGGDWVRYVHSLDGGDTWSTPFTIDRDGSDDGKLSNAGPVMAVVGQTVHIIWAAGDPFLYRYHRYSRNAGQTWSPPARIMGDLNGQAFDGLAVDGEGRLHYFAQIRFPQGIYHSYWDGDHWTTPNLIYLIRSNGSERIGDRIHAHNTNPAVRDGNQLVLTFADPPPDANRRLFTMNLVMPDVPPATIEPTPVIERTAEISPTPIVSPTPTSQPVATGDEDVSTLSKTPSLNQPLWIGFIPTFMILFGVIVYRAFIKPKH